MGDAISARGPYNALQIVVRVNTWDKDEGEDPCCYLECLHASPGYSQEQRETWGRDVESWGLFCAAGIEIPDQPGVYLVRASIWEDDGIATDNGAAEYSAGSFGVVVRPATLDEAAGALAPLAPICRDCGEPIPGTERTVGGITSAHGCMDERGHDGPCRFDARADGGEVGDV